MLRNIIGFTLILSVLFSCQQSASSKYEVVQLSSDRISDVEKIRIFEESANIMSGPAYAAIAKLYANTGDYESALTTIHQAILQEPMNSFYHTLKSNYAYELNDLSAAYREALTAYQLGSKSLEESLILARMGVALSEFSIVDNIIDSLVIVYPNDPEVVFMAARKFEKSGQTGQAIDQYQKGIILDPQRIENYYYLAQLYLALENAKSAIKMLESFELPNLEPRLAIVKAEAFKSSGIIDSAAAYYNFLVAHQRDSLVYMRLIDMYNNSERRQELSEISTLAADSFPQSKFFVENAGKILDNRYKYDEALVYYRRLYELDTLDTLVTQEISLLQRKIAYLQRKRAVERIENSIPIQRATLPSRDSIN